MSVTTRMSLAMGKHVARIRGKPKHNMSLSTSCIIANEPLTKTVQYDGVRKIIMSSQKTRNALSMKMMEDLIAGITCNQNDPSLRCILLYGEGRVFSAGHNLKELTSKDGSEFHHEVFATCSRLMLGILQCPVPVIAVVQGLAAAAGCQLVASCDIAICSDNSSFSTPGANFGIFCSTPGIAVGRAVPKKVAAHMLFTGLPLSAEEALRAGLVSKVVPAEDLEEEVRKIVDSICNKSRAVIELGKKFFYQQLETDIRTAYRMGEEIMVNNLAMSDGQEGVRSFIEKRKPCWTHSSEKCH
ncbi:enoyl-CoA hydratase domain-containing protein 3, mitochondrial isoform X2 [Schistocerca americana]|uniref:enoyl-CoA hydratase domain-containing protein 3, mitochondrial n=1 Tax=Schistocerca piceifrons TaxID=274613 RepID=UPI001F4F9A90|nr:enoyl-CoA hydratase domain-containing protein 3, mitochondrial isoform X2 [Schistocerca americana]XP_047108034.1 enoyl-CoA hydratase domain-containing protein 3, mitochondrial [Schistocerca piceifrons]XP_049774690.1 enoyl-CoA hydratase domain-containing protein 3, mitochondrial [Schistocerca cancellata]XP_049852672.1 enoyl-CoA hydratase domain-containing protein 3, mitochondrial [Schistocerca gregaria]XP_049950239.1 enoyl-CoA hydratase domain-containing protein 3, mitochondrial [Schistocerca